MARMERKGTLADWDIPGEGAMSGYVWDLNGRRSLQDDMWRGDINGFGHTPFTLAKEFDTASRKNQ